MVVVYSPLRTKTKATCVSAIVCIHAHVCLCASSALDMFKVNVRAPTHLAYSVLGVLLTVRGVAILLGHVILKECGY